MINLLSRGEDGGGWFYWPLAAWGIGLLVHAITTYTSLFSEGWKARKAQEIYEQRGVRADGSIEPAEGTDRDGGRGSGRAPSLEA